MTATILPFGPLKMVYSVPCSNPYCRKVVTLRTPARESVDAYCSPGCARAHRPDWFKVSVGGDSHA